MSSAYRNNHYVPQWYQKRFIPDGTRERVLWHLDLKPTSFRYSKGRSHTPDGVTRRGPRKCFVERDLYTIFGTDMSTEIEQQFFGQIDRNGKKAVELYSDYSITGESIQASDDLIGYMGAQKLRTPKGIRWIREQADSPDRHKILELMTRNQRMYAAIWSECVWLIADASKSNTKFIVSDHPVTVYNRRCGPKSRWCRRAGDPDVRMAATHTIFPLSLNKVLILTNLSWARNPYQDPLRSRPNPRLDRRGMFNALRVQTDRFLNEHEVLEINFILKSRADRYVAAGKEEWLYPELRISKSDWANYGDGYLLMPDPRALNMGGTVYLGYDDGRSEAADEYGRKPWEDGFETGASPNESVALDRFKGEFARRSGPLRRGRDWSAGGELERERDSDEHHAYFLSLEAENEKLMKDKKYF